MTMIDVQEGAIQLEASLIGEGLRLEAAQVPALLRDGEVTARCERGVDEDQGRYRLSFFHQNRRFRLVIDEAGHILHRSSIAFTDRPLPASLRQPGS